MSTTVCEASKVYSSILTLLHLDISVPRSAAESLDLSAFSAPVPIVLLGSFMGSKLAILSLYSLACTLATQVLMSCSCCTRRGLSLTGLGTEGPRLAGPGEDRLADLVYRNVRKILFSKNGGG